MLRKIHQIAAYAKDIQQTKEFYTRILGATFLAQFGNPPSMLFLDFEGTRLLFETSGPPITIYFSVDDIVAVFSELSAKGIEFDSAPHVIHQDHEGVFGQKGDNEWMAFFKDPSGNTLAIASQKPSE